jgi:hypothetical protein
MDRHRFLEDFKDIRNGVNKSADIRPANRPLR